MPTTHDTFTAETGIAALTDGRPARSELLEEALAAGGMIRAVLAGATQARLGDADVRRVEAWLGRGAAAGAYGGMALWTLNALTIKNEAAGRAAEAIAGLSIGLLAADRRTITPPDSR